MSDEILPLGVMTNLHDDPRASLQKVRDMGFPTCQLGDPPENFAYGSPEQRREQIERVHAAIEEVGVTITAVFIMFKGHRWNLKEGPATIGLVPEDKRGERMVHACRIAEWTAAVGIGAVTTHVGFIPEDASAPLYESFVRSMKAFARYCGDLGLSFAFETGQETPRTLRRTIDDIDEPNVGVNLDPANLILYGKGTPMEAVEAFGEFIHNTHCKDGVSASASGEMGTEVPLGEGEVNFPRLLKALYDLGFRGPLTIEREIFGEQQIEDIKKGKAFLEQIRAGLVGG